MSEKVYLAKVRRALFARGVWGAEARRITEQLGDHSRTMIHDLCADGASLAEAEHRTFTALGGAEVVADAAAADVRSRRWLTRHPWLLASVIFLATFACWITIGIASFYVAGVANSTASSTINVPILQVGTTLMNWLPFFIGCVFLSWWAWRSTGSWKALLIASAAIGLATSSFFARVDPSPAGPGHGIFSIGGPSWVALGLKIAAACSETIRTAMGGNPSGQAFDGWTLLRMLLPIVSVLLARQFLLRLKPA